MTQISIPTEWTKDQAAAAIEIVEALLDALWRQYPNLDDGELDYDLSDWILDIGVQTEEDKVSNESEGNP